LKSAAAARRRGAVGDTRADPRLIDRLLVMQGRICPLCGTGILPGAKIHVDHKLSVARGGRHEEGNLQVTHARCNLKKGAG
jgi:5-methylcytosine-specific restriction endonuclease McrA